MITRSYRRFALKHFKNFFASEICHIKRDSRNTVIIPVYRNIIHIHQIFFKFFGKHFFMLTDYINAVFHNILNPCPQSLNCRCIHRTAVELIGHKFRLGNALRITSRSARRKRCKFFRTFHIQSACSKRSHKTFMSRKSYHIRIHFFRVNIYAPCRLCNVQQKRYFMLFRYSSYRIYRLNCSAHVWRVGTDNQICIFPHSLFNIFRVYISALIRFYNGVITGQTSRS